MRTEENFRISIFDFRLHDSGRIFDFRISVFDLEEEVSPMTEAEMKQRTHRFALRVLKLAEALPRTRTGQTIAGQIMRSGSSVAANYRSLCRAKSRADFINKTSIIEEEADETAFWLETIQAAGLLANQRVQPLLNEANELIAIIVASRRTAISRSG
jgi:four helix bundle protein